MVRARIRDRTEVWAGLGLRIKSWLGIRVV